MTRAGMIRTDQNPPNPLFKGEGRLDGGREDRLLTETMIMALLRNQKLLQMFFIGLDAGLVEWIDAQHVG
jgi:hypothetical protein